MIFERGGCTPAIDPLDRKPFEAAHLCCGLLSTPACQFGAVHPQFAAIIASGEFMVTFRVRSFHAGLMLATALAVSMWPATGRAYTPEQEQACTSDAFRLCSSEIPNVDRVTACMVAKKSQLSPPCRAQFGPDPAPSQAAAPPAGRPMAISPATSRKSVSAKRKARKPARKPAST
jgi:hypothetical protein